MPTAATRCAFLATVRFACRSGSYPNQDFVGHDASGEEVAMRFGLLQEIEAPFVKEIISTDA